MAQASFSGHRTLQCSSQPAHSKRHRLLTQKYGNNNIRSQLLSERPPPHGPINMSTDDSISEDVSSSGALSHCHASADGDGGKESETSLVSSEGTSASGLAGLEERCATSKTTGGTVESIHVDITPACNRIRNLCLSTDEAFEHGKTLPFINPSSLETLRALVQEIQSSGETDPEIWKDCE
ncbi:hypothetical protein CHARACLAT_024033, partial [Characodon lateralis]|nr:hypothetical protein [Characodon lateralis]